VQVIVAIEQNQVDAALPVHLMSPCHARGRHVVYSERHADPFHQRCSRFREAGTAAGLVIQINTALVLGDTRGQWGEQGALT
jgi:hypothetical protein